MSTTPTFLKSNWIKAQKRRGPQMKNAPTFYRNLEEALDLRRADHSMFTCIPSVWKLGQAHDFSSNDTLSLSQTGEIRRAFLDELGRHPDFMMHSGGSRVYDGNYSYIEDVEAEIATFHGAETALIMGSGYEANVAIFTAIPRPGDAIVYDELVHASTLDGIATSLAQSRVSFRHNDVDAFTDAIASVLDSQPQIADGSRSVLVAVESLYSMEGDICPLADMLDVAKEMCPRGNVEFIIDEAHTTGNLGPKGAGLVSQLGLEKQIAVRLHTFGKALASSGAVILGNTTVRHALLNFARNIVFSTAPSFPIVAGMRAAYNILRDGKTQLYLDKVQRLVKHFFQAIESNPHWSEAIEQGIFNILGYEDWKDRQNHAHMVLVRTRHRVWWLFFELQLAGISVFPIEYPTVPRGQGRVRLMFHAANTEEQVELVVKTMGDWAAEMLAIEASSNGGKGKIPKAAQAVYAAMNSQS
ncbi:putative secondary metabolism biosynthetic enzyme [Claviceps pusilla]|uniref:Secondary metabolism biosynthetic enzyme n=1 Tax=Claviceps pusilla TaxID=123648 RepID=A0A9P7NFG0_9HYPO|nr:putative secondary metabolism biosynthetic enzyme [Claviceps pusilla]